jgi:undecaprenyl-diphosphatase
MRRRAGGPAPVPGKAQSIPQDYLLKVFVAFAITGAGGLLIEKKGFKLPETGARALLPVALALLIGGVLFVVVETWLRGKPHKAQITWTVVLAVAVGQLIAAVLPGSSRSGSTILFSLMLGLNRVAATEFSFLVGIPTMLAAGGWKLLKAFRHAATDAPQENWLMIALGFSVAAVVSFLAVKWLLRYVQNHTFITFGWYRIVLSVALIALFQPWNARDLDLPKPRAHGSLHESVRFPLYSPAQKSGALPGPPSVH